MQTQSPQVPAHPLHSQEWFNEAFQYDPSVPPQLRHMSERMCREFNIRGICDPMYIANIAAVEFGMGDGRGTFAERPVCPESIAIEALAKRLRFSYSTCIGRNTALVLPLLKEEVSNARWNVLTTSERPSFSG